MAIQLYTDHNVPRAIVDGLRSRGVDLPNVKGKAKPYQVKQFLALVERYNLHMEE